MNMSCVTVNYTSTVSNQAAAGGDIAMYFTTGTKGPANGGGLN